MDEVQDVQSRLTQRRAKTGISGLDQVLEGGLPEQAAYLVRGGPGSGKTTLCLHFLAEGVKDGESSLFISFGEPEEQLRHNAPDALNLAGIEFLDLSPSASTFKKSESYDVFPSSEVEGEPMIDTMRTWIDTIHPKRAVIDSMSHLRYLVSDAYQYKKQALGLIRLLTDMGATILYTSESADRDGDSDLQFMSDGVIELVSEGRVRRLTVPKLRGSRAWLGPHTYTLSESGLDVAPRLQAAEHARRYWPKLVSSGIAGLDELCGGGFHQGTTTIISGPTGVGKSNIGMVYMKEAAARGERTVVVNFEESRDMIIQRCRSINIPIEGMLDSGLITIHAIEPLTHSPDDLALLLREEVEGKKAKMVMLDSLGSFQLSVAGDDDIRQRLHETCRYLGNMGVTTFLIHETEQIVGNQLTTERFSYLTDNIMLLRYIKHEGALERVIGILKKRTGDFALQPLRYSISASGVRVHESLESISGLVPGLPSTDREVGHGNAENGAAYVDGNGREKTAPA